MLEARWYAWRSRLTDKAPHLFLAGGRRGGVGVGRSLAIRRRRFVHLLTHFFANLFNRGAERVADIVPIDNVARARIRPEMIDDEDDEYGQNDAGHHT